MGRSADDLALGLAAMAGADEIDGAGWQLRLPAPRKKSLREYKVAVMLTDPNSEVDQAVQDRLQALADFLARKKAQVSERARPDIDTAEAHRVYIRLLRAATSGRQTDEEFERNARTAAEPRPRRRQLLRAHDAGQHALASRLAGRRRGPPPMRWKWHEFFAEWDLLLCPAAASAAFPHDQKGERYERTVRVNGREVSTVDQLFWAGYSGAFYLPASVAPIGFTPARLPVGVQIVGPQHGDRTCIEFARLLEREFQPFVPPPGFE